MDERHGLDERRYRELDWKRATADLSRQEADELERMKLEMYGKDASTPASAGPTSSEAGTRQIGRWPKWLRRVVRFVALGLLVTAIAIWLLGCLVLPHEALRWIFGIMLTVLGSVFVLAGSISPPRSWGVVLYGFFLLVFGVGALFGFATVCDQEMGVALWPIS